MRQILHIVTRSNDAFAQSMIDHEKAAPDHNVEMIDLTQPKPDYKELVKKIFAADSLQVW